jgi:hypothetical protein
MRNSLIKIIRTGSHLDLNKFEQLSEKTVPHAFFRFIFFITKKSGNMKPIHIPYLSSSPPYHLYTPAYFT